MPAIILLFNYRMDPLLPIPEQISSRLRKGERVSVNDTEFGMIMTVVNETLRISALMNASGKVEEVRRYLREINGQEIDESTAIFPPFYINFGRFTTIGKRVFINHNCSFLDLGGIIIEDDVLIGPGAKLLTENHPLDPSQRKDLVCQPIHISQNAWIGAGAIILPGVSVGRNAVVAAGAVVTKSVDDNRIVGGVPAKVIGTVPAAK